MEAIIWYISWPVVMYLTWQFVRVNVKHLYDLERLAECDAKRGYQESENPLS
jgi:hypothetical protein